MSSISNSVVNSLKPQGSRSQGNTINQHLMTALQSFHPDNKDVYKAIDFIIETLKTTPAKALKPKTLNAILHRAYLLSYHYNMHCETIIELLVTNFNNKIEARIHKHYEKNGVPYPTHFSISTVDAYMNSQDTTILSKWFQPS